MAKRLPDQYVEQYIYQYVGYVKQKSNGKLVGGCPICKEGKSWGKKARFCYRPEFQSATCVNCGYSNSVIGFIADMTGLEFRQIWDETKEYDIIPRDLSYNYNNFQKLKRIVDDLPENSINLFDKLQVSYYEDNFIVRKALEYIKSRKIDTAPNKPKALYISLTDFVHKNRLVIPYYDDNKVIWYQTRRILDDDSEKYLSKMDSERSLFNIDNIDQNIPYIFIFEGAIDSMFVQNATCVSGITEEGEFMFTSLQKQQFNRYPFHERVWVLDSPFLDDAARNKTEILYKKEEKIFDWPEKLGKKCKDFNDVICLSSQTKIPYEFIIRNLKKENNLVNTMKYLLKK